MGTTPNVPHYSTSAALLFTEQELGGPCNEVESLVTINTGTPQTLVIGNGDRVGLIFFNTGQFVVNIGTVSANVSTAGIALQPGSSITMTVRDDFTLTSRNWFGAALINSSIVYVLEIVRFTSGSYSQS